MTAATEPLSWMEHAECRGIWGGKSEQERRAMRRTRPPAPSVTDQVVSMMRPDVTYSAENLRQLIGHRSHSTVTAALRALVDDGRVVCVRQFRNSRLPALYQLAGGGGS